MAGPTSRGRAEVYTYIGQRLRELRARKRVNQSAVAKLMNISVAQYSKYEDGSSKRSIANLIKASEFFEVDISLILPLSPQDYEHSVSEAPHQPLHLVSNQSTPQPKRRLSPSKGHIDDLGGITDTELLAELLEAFMNLPTREERFRLVEILKMQAS